MPLLDTPRPSHLALLAAIAVLAAPVSCRGQEEGFAASLDRDDVVPAATVGSTPIYVHRNLNAVAEQKPRLLETVGLGLDSIGRHGEIIYQSGMRAAGAPGESIPWPWTR